MEPDTILTVFTMVTKLRIFGANYQQLEWDSTKLLDKFSEEIIFKQETSWANNTTLKKYKYIRLMSIERSKVQEVSSMACIL